MEYFVRYAKVRPHGGLTKPGWRVRLFATATEARAFSLLMSLPGWRVEVGALGDAPPACEPACDADLDRRRELLRLLRTLQAKRRARAQLT
jgi:hypothetical protein